MKPNLKILFLSVFLTSSYFVQAQFGYLTGKVRDKFGPLNEATVSLEGTPFGVITDVKGYYAFQLDTGAYKMVIEKPGYNSITRSIIVREFQSTEVDYMLVSTVLEQDVASGSMSKVLVRQMESSVPIDVVTGQDILNTNQPNLSAALHYLVPTLYATDVTIADGSDFVTPVAMRGLSPDQVLVLVNGKRRHKSALVHVNGTFGRGAAGTDINSIPMSSIDRIEILRYGAAAQYGSDAISGVLNIVLKKLTGSLDFRATVAKTLDGTGSTDKFSANYGFGIGKNGYLNLTCEFLDKKPLDRSGLYEGIIYDDVRDNDQVERDAFFSETEMAYGRIMEVGAAGTQNANLTFNGSFEMGKEMELYYFGGINYRKGSSTGFYRLPYDSVKVVHSLFPYGFSPEIRPDILDQSFVVGERGVINGWTFDFSINVAESSFEYTINNSLNASMGINSPTNVYAGGFDYGHKMLGFNITKLFQTIIPVNLSFGAEYKLENFSIHEGDVSSYLNGGDTTAHGQPRDIGFQVFSGFTPDNEIKKLRSNVGGYVELKGDVTSKLEVILASRLESYFNEYGPNVSLKATGRYKFSDLMILRGGYSTGFKAPSLHQLYYSRVSTQFIDGNAVRVANFNNQSPVTDAFGIDLLRPEVSKNYSIGLTSRPIRNFSTSLDFYRIDIDDRIVLTGLFRATDDPDYAAILNPLNVGSAQFFTNAVATTTQGIDFFLDYKLVQDNSELALSVGYNYSKSEVTNIEASGILSNKTDILFNREEVSRLEVNVPTSKLIFNARYSIKKLSISMRNTYFGEVKYVHPDDGDPANWVLNTLSGRVESRDQIFAAKVITDVDVAYQIFNGVSLSVGGNNIFNVYPDKQTHSANIEEGRFVYSRRVQQFGVMGAYYFGQLTIKL